MNLSDLQESEYIRVKDIQKIHIEPGEVLLIVIGIDGMSQEEAISYANNVGKTFREHLPNARMMISTTTQQRPLDVIKISEGDLLMDVITDREREAT